MEIDLKEFINKYSNKRICILEGQTSLPEPMNELEKVCLKNNIPLLVLEDLFEDIYKIVDVVTFKPQIIAFSTSGMEKDKIGMLISFFEKMNIIPEEIWESRSFSVVDTDKYNSYNFYILNNIFYFNKF